MEPTELPPITEVEIKNALNEADHWWRTSWGATMSAAQSRDMARDVVKLVALVRQLQAQLANHTNDGEPAFFYNPCNRCGALPGVRCPHDE